MLANMKFIILLLVTISAALGDTASQSSSNNENAKPDTKTPNSIPTTPQKSIFYQMPSVQHRPPYIQYIQKPVYVPQQPQATMLIIAQPAIVPQHLLYGHAAQQLLNYFHNNPQAKYQFLHGSYQQQQQQQQQQAYLPQTAHTFATPQYSSVPQNYQLVVAPQNYAAPTHVQYAQYNPTTQYSQSAQYSQQSTPTTQYSQSTPTTQYSQSAPTTQYSQAATTQYSHSTPTTNQYAQYNQIQPSYQQHQQQTYQSNPSLSQIAQYASLSAQQYTNAPIKSAPPIITGLEHFTPEQQSQIKEHLNTHFAANGLSSSQPQFGTKYTTEASVTSQTEFQPMEKQQESQSSSNFAPSSSYKSQYSKG